MTDFMKQLAERMKNGEGFVVGLVQMQPVVNAQGVASTSAVFTPRAIIAPSGKKDAGAAAETLSPGGGAAVQLTAKLNSLVTGGIGNGDDSGAGAGHQAGFAHILDMLQEAQKGGKADLSAAAASGASSPVSAKIAGAGLSTIEDVGAADGDSQNAVASTAAQTAALYPDGLQGAAGAAHGVTLNMTNMTSLTASNVQAGQPHPAAQAVAAALVQAADDGETKSFTLKLDPPDLGHIEVQMDFAKDKTLKATHIVTDKQDTLLLLQRDSHVLQKALQDSGVDSSGGGNISFALSKDGGGNNGGQQNQGGRQNTGAPSGEEGGTIIASTMNWLVDPETGTVHYSLLA
jgi:hypothetical protein